MILSLLLASSALATPSTLECGIPLVASVTSPRCVNLETSQLPPSNPWLQGFLIAHRFMLANDIDPRDLANNIEKLVRDGNVWPMWVCVYADGTVVHNKFRWYRDAAAVTRYFFGEPDRHDRDAYYFVGGRRYAFDTRFAQQFAQQHGGVVKILSIE